MKKEQLKKIIIKWSLYAILMIATILIFVFSDKIFGGPLVKVDPADPDSDCHRSLYNDPDSVSDANH